jgi:hypothetical protein
MEFFGFFIVYLRLCEFLSFPEELIPRRKWFLTRTQLLESIPLTPNLLIYGLSIQKYVMPQATTGYSMVKSGGS